MKLDENERANTIRLMKVKDMLLKEAIEEKREADERAIEAFGGRTGRRRRRKAAKGRTCAGSAPSVLF